GNKRLIAVFEPRSNTMKMGVHQQTLGQAFVDADAIFMFQDSQLGWSLNDMQNTLNDKLKISDDIDLLVRQVTADVQAGDYIVVMSNGGFAGIHDKLLKALAV
ncbi:MAG: UDP-N-acetylmuramate:L-alanyl-gamma-D-glutamyl-meso-diaminopimelate ligase, partial [Methylophaga sp.]